MKGWILIFGILAFLAVPFSANAITIYEDDGTKVNLDGDLQVQLRRDIGVNEDPYFDYDDLEVAFSGTHDLQYNLSAFGMLKMDWKKDVHGDGGSPVDEAYAGLKYEGLDSVKLSGHAGRLDWGSDDFQVEQAYEIEGPFIFPDNGGDESVRFDINGGIINAALSGDIEEKADNATNPNNDSVAEAYVYSKYKGLNIGILAQTYKKNEDADSVKTYGARLTYNFEYFDVGMDYSTRDGNGQDYKDIDHSTNFVVKAPVPKVEGTEVASGYGIKSPDEGDDVNTWYANITHKFDSNVSTFAEVGDNDVKNSEGKETDIGYLAGLRFQF